MKRFGFCLILVGLVLLSGVSGAWALEHAAYYAGVIEYDAYGNITDNSMYMAMLAQTTGHAPVLDQIAAITVTEGDVVTIVPNATDPDGDTITYSYDGWMTSDTYTTNLSDAGVHVVTVTAFDGNYAVSQDIVITVINTNNAPIISPISNITVNEGETISLSPVYNDPDGDQLTVVYSGWMNTADYTTTYEDAGSHNVTITVNDGELSDSIELQITVNNVNQAPEIKSLIPNPSPMVEDGAIVIDLSAYESDPDEEASADLKWSVTGFSNGTVSGENSADDLLTFTPNANFFGSETITLILTDKDGLTDSQDITLTWDAANDPLTVSDIDDKTIVEGSIDQSIDLDSYVTDVEDADADITWAVSGNTNLDVSIDADTHLVTIVANAGWRGTETLTFTATDTGGASSSDTCLITVSPLYGTVAGTITDQLSANPVSGITVKLLDPQDSSEIAAVTTDAAGNYIFENVLAQSYHVFVDTTGFEYDAEYYDNAKDIAMATEISVIGDNLANINFDLIDLEQIDLNIDLAYNLLSFSVVPLDLKDATMASDVVNYFALNSITFDSIKQWNGDEWQTYRTDLSFTDFNFDFKYGFAANVSSNGTFSMEGINIKLPYIIHLEQGWNLINVPYNLGTITYNRLANAMDLAGANVTQMMILEFQNLNSYTVGDVELDSNIEFGRSFFVKCDNEVDFTFE